MTVADLFNQLIVVGFGSNFLLTIFLFFLAIAVLAFWQKWGMAEIFFIGALTSGVFFVAGIDQSFTNIYALVLLLVGLVFIIAMWRQFANG